MTVRLIVGDDWRWFLLNFIPLWCIWAVFPIFVEDAGPVTFFSYYIVSTNAYLIPWYSVCYWHREMSPFRLIGAKAKFMIEVIPMIVAAALHHLLEYNVGYFVILLGCTACVYIFTHFMHAAYDIEHFDFLLGLAMLVLVHWLNEELLVGVLVLSFCLCLSFYRYMTYCAPELPNHPKKELEEELPC
nr:uncharacterized protein LOC104121110 [Nicotiana tomentosiformis]